MYVKHQRLYNYYLFLLFFKFLILLPLGALVSVFAIGKMRPVPLSQTRCEK